MEKKGRLLRRYKKAFYISAIYCKHLIRSSEKKMFLELGYTFCCKLGELRPVITFYITELYFFCWWRRKREIIQKGEEETMLEKEKKEVNGLWIWWKEMEEEGERNIKVAGEVICYDWKSLSKALKYYCSRRDFLILF